MAKRWQLFSSFGFRHSFVIRHSSYVIRLPRRNLGEAASFFRLTFVRARRCRAILSHVAGRGRSGSTVPSAMSAPVPPLSRPCRLRKKRESCWPARTSNWPECSDENRSALVERFRQTDRAFCQVRVPLVPPELLY